MTKVMCVKNIINVAAGDVAVRGFQSNCFKFCPIMNLVQQALNGLCYPIANSFYQMIRPENLIDLDYGVKIINKKVPTNQEYEEELKVMRALITTEEIISHCKSWLMNHGSIITSSGKELPLIANPNLRLIICLQPKTIRNFILAFNQALNFLSKIVHRGFKNLQEIESEFLSCCQTLEIKGQYRQKGLIICDVNLLDAKAFDAYLLKKGFTKKMMQKSYALAASAYELSKEMYGNEDYPQFSDEYKLLMKDVMDFAPKFHLIPSLMEEFFKNLQEKLSQAYQLGVTDQDYIIAIAAWAHQELIKIHPLDDGNGRVARLFMNAILKFFEIDPIVLLNNQCYVEAVRKDIQNPGVFADYLIKVALSEMQNNKALASWDNKESIIKRVEVALI